MSVTSSSSSSRFVFVSHLSFTNIPFLSPFFETVHDGEVVSGWWWWCCPFYINLVKHCILLLCSMTTTRATKLRVTHGYQQEKLMQTSQRTTIQGIIITVCPILLHFWRPKI